MPNRPSPEPRYGRPANERGWSVTRLGGRSNWNEEREGGRSVRPSGLATGRRRDERVVRRDERSSKNVERHVESSVKCGDSSGVTGVVPPLCTASTDPPMVLRSSTPDGVPATRRGKTSRPSTATATSPICLLPSAPSSGTTLAGSPDSTESGHSQWRQVTLSPSSASID